MIDLIIKSKIFNGLTTAAVTEFIHKTGYQIKEYKTNGVIYYSGAKCNHLSFLLEGEIHGELFGENGKTVIVDTIVPPDTFAEAFLFSSEALFYVNVVAATDCKILIIDKNAFLNQLCHNTQILENYLRAISDRLVSLTKRIRTFSLMTLEAKIANFVLEKEKYCKNGIIECSMTHEKIADYFGVSRPSFSRQLGQMKRDNIVEFKSGKINILNRQKLMDLLH